MSNKLDFEKPIFVIEHCVDCHTHRWNTRHDEAKYKSFAADLASRIQQNVPDATILYNQVPKKWYEKEIYCQLIPNEDEKNDLYDMFPRMGAFELSTVVEKKGRSEAILLYSKIISGMWPHFGAVAKRVQEYSEANFKDGQGVSDLRQKFSFNP